jgi:hypothetical protein
VVNNDRLTLGDGGKMKLNTDPFPIGMIEIEHKKMLVCMDQAEMTKGKNVVIFDDLHNRMIRNCHMEEECAEVAS